MTRPAATSGPPDHVLAYWQATHSDAGVRYLVGRWAGMSADQRARELRLAEGHRRAGRPPRLEVVR